MGFVTWLVQTADGYLNTVSETQFGAIAATIGTVLTASATLVIIFVSINLSYQWRSMDPRSAFWLCVKISLIGIFATNWVQFNYLSSAILDGIDSIGGSLIASVGGPGVGPSGTFAEEFDDILDTLAEYLNAVSDNLSRWRGALLDLFGVVLISLLGFLAASVLVGARLMIAVLLGLAPIMIFLTMFEATKDYFARWLSVTVSFALVPVFIAAAFSLVIGLTNELVDTLDDPVDAETLGSLMPFFMMVMMAKGTLVGTCILAWMISGNVIMPAIDSGLGTSAGVARGAANTRGVRYRRSTGNLSGAEMIGSGLRRVPGAVVGAPTTAREIRDRASEIREEAGQRVQRMAERARRLTQRPSSQV